MNIDLNFDDILKDIKQVKQELYNKLQISYSNAIQKIFQAYPDLECIAWIQFTPFFNDGEPCEWTIDGPYFIKDYTFEKIIEGDLCFNEDNKLCTEEQNYYSNYNNNNIIPLLLEEIITCGPAYKRDNPYIPKDVVSSLEYILENSENILKELFGHHSLVLVGRNSIHVEEYEHE